MTDRIIELPTHQTVCRMIPQPDGLYRIKIDAIVSPDTAIEVMKVLGAKVESSEDLPIPTGPEGQMCLPTGSAIFASCKCNWRSSDEPFDDGTDQLQRRSVRGRKKEPPEAPKLVYSKADPLVVMN